MSEIETKRLCPKGSKFCPACKAEVKGPRTRVCPFCQNEFFKSASKPVKTAKPVKVVAVAKGIDPYTFNVDAMGNFMAKGVNVSRKAAAIFPAPKGFIKVTEYIDKMEKIVNPTIPNDVTFVF